MFQDRQGASRVAVALFGEEIQGVGVHLDLQGAEAAFGVSERALDELLDGVGAKRLEDEHAQP